MSTLVVVVIFVDRDSVLGPDGHRSCHLLELSSNVEELRVKVVAGENAKANPAPPADLERARCASRNGNAMRK